MQGYLECARNLFIFNSEKVKIFTMQVRKFLIKVAVFCLLNLVVLFSVLLFFSGRNRDIRLDVSDTESNLLASGANEHYGVAFLGTSRGRVFSRDRNHQMVEAILGRRLINLAKGGGGGLMPAKVHLAHFFSRGNRVDHIFYLVDPWVFFSAINNENNTFFLRDEPFELSILLQLIADRFPLSALFSYLQMIAVDDWQTISRYAGPGLTSGTLSLIDELKLEKAREHYLELYVKKSFVRYCRFVDTSNELARKNGSRITYIMLPLLIPDFPGIAEVDLKLKSAALSNSHVTYFNLAAAMQDRHFYYDHMHFNKKGISYFTKNVIDPILRGQEPLSRTDCLFGSTQRQGEPVETIRDYRVNSR